MGKLNIKVSLDSVIHEVEMIQVNQEEANTLKPVGTAYGDTFEECVMGLVNYFPQEVVSGKIKYFQILGPQVNEGKSFNIAVEFYWV